MLVVVGVKKLRNFLDGVRIGGVGVPERKRENEASGEVVDVNEARVGRVHERVAT